MKHGGIIASAIDVLSDIEARHRPATEALRDWGLSHRFAGAGDRAAIGNLVFDALRRRASTAWRMGSEIPRAVVIGTYGFVWQNGPDEIEAVFASDRHAPDPLSEEEKIALVSGTLDGAPPHVAGDYPEWLHGAFVRVFGEEAAAEGAALAERAPVDLRANTLKASREKVLKALGRFSPEPTPFAPTGIRVGAGEGPARPPHVMAEAGYRKGWFEIQDEGSQLAALLCGAAPGSQVADICAGAGGKTLALAAGMANKGQIYAWDADRRRLADIHERVQRAGARNVQIREAGSNDALRDLEGRMDVVLVDAPCTGAGTWRRRPDAKWRVGEKALAERLSEQRAALETAAAVVRPGGRLVYVTCSVLPEENEDQLAGFRSDYPQFSPVPAAELIGAALEPGAGAALRSAVLERPGGLQLTPRRTGTDGFFIAVLKRQGG